MNYFKRLSSLDYLLNCSDGSKKICDSIEQRQKTIMNAPILKLHMKASGDKMNKNNAALSAEE